MDGAHRFFDALMPSPQSHQADPAAQYSEETSSLQSVYEAATNLFLANTFQTVSLRQIAESAGVPQGSLHKLLGSKDDLLYQLLVRFELGLLEEIKQQLPRSIDCLTAMRRFAEIYIKYGAARRTDLLLARRDMHLLSQEHQHSILGIRDKLVTRVWEITAVGQAKKVFRLAITAGATVGGMLYDGVGYQATFISSGIFLIIATTLSVVTNRWRGVARHARRTLWASLLIAKFTMNCVSWEKPAGEIGWGA